jgi:phosphate transport system protein
MGSRAEEAIGRAVRALTLRDARLAREVIDADAAINDLETEIDEFCIQILALYQPEARDLRFVTMAFKINRDLERIGDMAVNIAERTFSLLKEPYYKPLTDLPRMAQLAQTMVKESLDALVNGDAELARRVCRQDAQVDELKQQIYQELIRQSQQDSRYIEGAVSLILVARHLERIADHATNIAEDVIYAVEGKTTTEERTE